MPLRPHTRSSARCLRQAAAERPALIGLSGRRLGGPDEQLKGVWHGDE